MGVAVVGGAARSVHVAHGGGGEDEESEADREQEADGHPFGEAQAGLRLVGRRPYEVNSGAGRRDDNGKTGSDNERDKRPGGRGDFVLEPEKSVDNRELGDESGQWRHARQQQRTEDEAASQTRAGHGGDGTSIVRIGKRSCGEREGRSVEEAV